MNNKYLVTLKPMGSFFFGSERTFGLGKDNEHYIIQSEYFPQQTSILGMIRKEILIIKDLIRDDWDYSKTYSTVNELIGKESFDITKTEKQEFGIIKSISPVFIKKDDNYFISIPKDHKIKEKDKHNKKYTPLNFDDKSKCKVNLGNSSKEIYIPYDYVAKDGLSNDFISKDKEIIKINHVLKEDEQIGIKLENNKKTSDNGLYKVIRYRLEKNYEFAFNLDINFNSDFQEKDLEQYSNIVNLGGEGSYFKISFQKTNNDIENNFEDINRVREGENNEIYKKIILLSNGYISKEEYDKYCDYGIINGVTFRNLRTDYSKFKEKEKYYKKFEKTNKFIFLERGSVLFSTKNNYYKLKDKLDSNFNINNIGYNKYI